MHVIAMISAVFGARRSPCFVPPLAPSQDGAFFFHTRFDRCPRRQLASITANYRASHAHASRVASAISVFVEASLFLARDKPRLLLRLKRFLSFQSAAHATQRRRPPELDKARICPHAAELPAPSHRFSPLPRIHSATLESPPSFCLSSATERRRPRRRVHHSLTGRLVFAAKIWRG